MRLSKRKKIIALAAAALVVLAGGAVWAHLAGRWVSTDNAYVAANTARVTAQIEGFVAEVLVADNARVEAGQALIRLDPADAAVSLAEARAELARARAASVEAGRQEALQAAQVSERAAALASARAAADLARADYGRYLRLAEKDLVAPQRLESIEAQTGQARATVAQAEAGLLARRRGQEAVRALRAQAQAALEAAQARVAQAELALARTTITAPIAGVVGDLSARPGEAVRPGAQLMAVVPLGAAYVVANFKETQLAKLRIGQAVELAADAFPGARVHGWVESFAPASGSEFALIPVEHASGNFTKITQRLPVRIALDHAPTAQALRPGLSLEVKVDVRSPGGASFAEAAVAPQRQADAAP